MQSKRVRIRVAGLQLFDFPKNLERAAGIEPAFPAWEADSGALYLQHLHKCFGKLGVHSAHAVPWIALFARHCGTFAGQNSHRARLFGNQRKKLSPIFKPALKPRRSGFVLFYSFCRQSR